MRRVARFFFMQIGSFVPVFAYFYLCGAAFTAEGVRHALLVALVVDSAYIALAWSQGEVKQFDAGIWTLFATGTLATRAGIEPVLRLYQRYSPMLLFVTLGLTALMPLLPGRDTFPSSSAPRQFPRGQRRVPVFHAGSGVMTAYWPLLFFPAASLAAFAPTDWPFPSPPPTLMISGAGMPAPVWLPPL